MKPVYVTLLGAMALWCGACANSTKAEDRNTASQGDVVAFVHASVIPMDTERILQDQTVVVANGTIVEIGPASAVKVPAEAQRVDATGRYLLPALSDMHVHLLGESWNEMLPPEEQLAREEIPFESFLFPYVANGVTTVQVLMATPEDLAARERIAKGELLGPRLVLARMVDGPDKAWPPPLSTWVDSAAEAREAVLRAKADGYDKIKVYSFLNKESYDAIIATAREADMDVIGHVPMSLSVEYVLESGQKAIAHSEEVAKHAPAYDAEQVDYFANQLVQSGAWMIPTLETTHTFLEIFEQPDRLFMRPGAEYFVHPMQRGAWSFMWENLYAPAPAAHRQKLKDAFVSFQQPLTRAFHDKGGKLLAGSDTLMPGLLPGVSLHDELKELVDVGLTPYEALRTATINPAQYLGESETTGTIEVGKRSDLLLVEENPLADVSAASKVAGVLVRGRWLGQDEIQRRMQQIAEAQGPARTGGPAGEGQDR
jgi:imidazolonepropionase-like amidohydrolase